jgi:hypothetical protein
MRGISTAVPDSTAASVTPPRSGSYGRASSGQNARDASSFDEPRGGGADRLAVLVDGHERHAGDVEERADLLDQLLERVMQPALGDGPAAIEATIPCE